MSINSPRQMCMSFYGILDSMLITLIVLALLFGFLNGLNDSANVVSTVISSRALSARAVLMLTALGEFVGPLLFGAAIARTIGAGLLQTQIVTLEVMASALLGAIVWNILTWYLGIPSSSSHALVGGLLGAAITAGGLAVVQLPGLLNILLALFLSPPLGLLAGYLVTKATLFLFRNASPKVNVLFRRSQIFTSFGLALSHGANDAQKTIGVITLVLLVSGEINEFITPRWVILAAAGAMALGTSIGGWRLIRTLGGRILKVRPVHGFASQLAGASVMLGAAALGGPVSATQVMSSAIMGTGAAERINKVRWQVAQEMLTAWALTIPIAGLMAGLFYLAFTYLSR